MKNIVNTVISGAGLRLFPFLLSILTLKKIGEIEYINFTYTLSYANAVLTIIMLGLSAAILSAEYSANETKKFVGAALTKGVFLSFLGCVLVYISTSMFAVKLINRNDVALFVFFSIQQIVLVSINQAELRGDRSLVIVFIQIISFAIIYFYETHAYGIEINVIRCYWIAVFLSVLTGYYLMMREYGMVNIECGKGLWKGILDQGKLGGYIAIWQLCIFLCVDYVAKNYSSREQATFNFGYQIFSIISYIPGLFGYVLIPKLTKNLYRNKLCEVIKISMLFTLISTAICFYFFFYMRDLFDFFGIYFDLVNSYVYVVYYVCAVIMSSISPLIQFFISIRNYGTLYTLSIGWGIVVGITACVVESMSGFMMGILTAYLLAASILMIKLRINLSNKT